MKSLPEGSPLLGVRTDRCVDSRFFRHSSHSPFGPGVPPHRHLRLSRVQPEEVKDADMDDGPSWVLSIK